MTFVSAFQCPPGAAKTGNASDIECLSPVCAFVTQKNAEFSPKACVRRGLRLCDPQEVSPSKWAWVSGPCQSGGKRLVAKGNTTRCTGKDSKRDQLCCADRAVDVCRPPPPPNPAPSPPPGPLPTKPLVRSTDEEKADVKALVGGSFVALIFIMSTVVVLVQHGESTRE